MDRLTDDLETLRKRILAVDRQIFALAAQRLHLVAQVGDRKKQQGLPVVNFQVEAEVLRRAMARGAALHLPVDFINKLSNLLIQAAIVAQEGPPSDRGAYLDEVAEQVAALEATGEAVIKLHEDEYDFPAPPRGTAAASIDRRGISRKDAGSSPGLLDLRQALAATESQRHHRTISAEQLVITPGGQFAVFAAFLALVSPGDRVLLPEPAGPLYDACARLVGGRVDVIPTRLEDAWRVSMAALEEALAVKPRLLVLSSPHNPTGITLTDAELEAFSHLAAARDAVVLSDERLSAYMSTPPTSVLDTTASQYLYVNQLPATPSLGGWRLGYAVSDSVTTARMTRLLQLAGVGVPEAIQQAAVKALDGGHGAVTAGSTLLTEHIDLACTELGKHPRLSFTRPNGGMFMFPRVDLEGFDSHVFAKTLLTTQRVAVAPGAAFGAYPAHFRVSLATTKRDLKEGMKRIGGLLEAWQ